MLRHEDYIKHDTECSCGDYGSESFCDCGLLCPLCGGPGIALGTLGYILHLRCRNCGADFSVDSPDSYEE